MDELGDSLGSIIEVLLNKGSGFLCHESLGVNLSSLDEDSLSMGSLKVLGEESADFGNNGSSFFVFTDLSFEFVVFLLSFSIEFRDFKFISLDFLLLLAHDALDDVSLRVELSF